MSTKEDFINLIGLKNDRDYSLPELEIEYETEIARIDAYRKWVVTLHGKMVVEAEALQKAKEAGEIEAAKTEVKLQKLANEIDVDDLHLSRRCIRTLRKIGINNLSDCTQHTAKELQSNPSIGLMNMEYIADALKDHSLEFKAEIAIEDAEAKAEAEVAAPAAEKAEVAEVKAEVAEKKAETVKKKPEPAAEKKEDIVTPASVKDVAEKLGDMVKKSFEKQEKANAKVAEAKAEVKVEAKAEEKPAEAPAKKIVEAPAEPEPEIQQPPMDEQIPDGYYGNDGYNNGGNYDDDNYNDDIYIGEEEDIDIGVDDNDEEYNNSEYF